MALGAAETMTPRSLTPKGLTEFALGGLSGAAAIGGLSQGNLGPITSIARAGYQTGKAALAGDPKAQGAALASVGGLALAARGSSAPAPRGKVNLAPSPKPIPDPLDIPAYQRRPAINAVQRFGSDQEVRLNLIKQRRKYTQHTAESILPDMTLQVPETAAPVMKNVFTRKKK